MNAAAWILSCCILILAVAGIRALFRKKLQPGFRYALWGIVLVRLLVPFSIGASPFSVASVTDRFLRRAPESAVVDEADHAEPAPGDAAVYPVTGIPADPLQPGEQNPGSVPDPVGGIPYAGQPGYEPGPDVPVSPGTHGGVPEIFRTLTPEDVRDIFLLVWIGGVAVFTTLFTFQNLQFYLRIRRRRRRCGNFPFCPLKVWFVNGIDSSCLFGKTVYLSSEALEDSVQLKNILRHELMHYRHGDHIWSVFRIVVLILHWYNPLVWWAAELSRRDGELFADSDTIADMNNEHVYEYGKTLIRLAANHKKDLSPLVVSSTAGSRPKFVKERVAMVVKQPKMTVFAVLIILAVLAAVVGGTFTGAASPGNGDHADGQVLPLQTAAETDAGIPSVTDPGDTEAETALTGPSEMSGTEPTEVPSGSEGPEETVPETVPTESERPAETVSEAVPSESERPEETVPETVPSESEGPAETVPETVPAESEGPAGTEPEDTPTEPAAADPPQYPVLPYEVDVTFGAVAGFERILPFVLSYFHAWDSGTAIPAEDAVIRKWTYIYNVKQTGEYVRVRVDDYGNVVSREPYVPRFYRVLWLETGSCALEVSARGYRHLLELRNTGNGWTVIRDLEQDDMWSWYVAEDQDEVWTVYREAAVKMTARLTDGDIASAGEAAKRVFLGKSVFFGNTDEGAVRAVLPKLRTETFDRAVNIERITGLLSWNTMVFSPDMPLVILGVTADEPFVLNGKEYRLEGSFMNYPAVIVGKGAEGWVDQGLMAH